MSLPDPYQAMHFQALHHPHRLVTVHDFGFCNPYPEHVDFISVQSWISTLYSFTLNTVNKYKDKPLFNIEHGDYSTYFWQGEADAILVSEIVK